MCTSDEWPNRISWEKLEVHEWTQTNWIDLAERWRARGHFFHRRPSWLTFTFVSLGWCCFFLSLHCSNSLRSASLLNKRSKNKSQKEPNENERTERKLNVIKGIDRFHGSWSLSGEVSLYSIPKSFHFVACVYTQHCVCLCMYVCAWPEHEHGSCASISYAVLAFAVGWWPHSISNINYFVRAKKIVAEDERNAKVKESDMDLVVASFSIRSKTTKTTTPWRRCRKWKHCFGVRYLLQLCRSCRHGGCQRRLSIVNKIRFPIAAPNHFYLIPTECCATRRVCKCERVESMSGDVARWSPPVRWRCVQHIDKRYTTHWEWHV